MMPKLASADYVAGYKMSIRYEDGTVVIVDLENELWGEVFEPLKDLSLFRKFNIDSELQTIV